MTPATDSIAHDARHTLAGILRALGLFQSLDRHISVESIKTLRHIALNENKSVHDYARMAGVGGDLPLKFHPVAIRVSADFTPSGAGGATSDRRSWSGLRSGSLVAPRLAA
jgi:hypothetical protein